MNSYLKNFKERKKTYSSEFDIFTASKEELKDFLDWINVNNLWNDMDKIYPIALRYHELMMDGWNSFSLLKPSLTNAGYSNQILVKCYDTDEYDDFDLATYYKTTETDEIVIPAHFMIKYHHSVSDFKGWFWKEIK